MLYAMMEFGIYARRVCLLAELVTVNCSDCLTEFASFCFKLNILGEYF